MHCSYFSSPFGLVFLINDVTHIDIDRFMQNATLWDINQVAYNAMMWEVGEIRLK